MTVNPGAKVVTRKGKRGTVLEVLANGNLLVAFSPTHNGFEMKPGQVILESAYNGMMSGTRHQQDRI